MITIINLLIDWFCEKRIMFLYNYRMHSLCIDENTYMMLKIKESLYYTYKTSWIDFSYYYFWNILTNLEEG